MRPIFTPILALVSVTTISRGEGDLLKLQAVPFQNVTIADHFWAPRQETNRVTTIPLNLQMLEKSGNLGNFERAAKGLAGGYVGLVFNDSDVYKALEAASYTLATHPDPELDSRLDAIIARVAAAQMPDGYLNTYYTLKEPGRRWTNLRDNHELYCAGHLFEAAVAHHRATGKTSLLDVARRFADHIASVFGPERRMGYPGHPEIELALIKLARETDDSRYFDLARFFVENRGTGFFAAEHRIPPDRYDGAYFQDDVPIREHRNIKGHAVRAAYLLSGVTDVAAETEDPGLLAMIDRVWRNTTRKNMYITGGIGPSAHNEGFTRDYDLPNASAYQETCASVALAQWNHRLALLYGDARYADVAERSLYNGVLAGVSLDGTRFFYVNPLESRGTHHRSEWFACACCPPNVARTIASLGGYAYAVGEGSLWVHLYIQGSVATEVDGKEVALDVTTDYPWDGEVVLKPRVEVPTPLAIRLRIPGWCREAAVEINGEPVADPTMERGYVVLDRTWTSGDTIRLDLPMPVERIAANPNVQADVGRLALQRGPIVYCLEGIDHEVPLSDLYLPRDAELRAEHASDLLGGVTVIEGTGAVTATRNWARILYQPAAPTQPVPIRAIPYYAWDNRDPGAMMVWLPEAPRPSPAGGLETQAEVTMSFVNSNCQPWAANDGVEPKSSGDQPGAICHWWPHRGGEEWIRYTWKTPVTVSASRVYWFDDTGVGACRLPETWRLEYLDNDDWTPVPGADVYPVVKDGWCEVEFQPITTSALRLVVTMRPDWAAGVQEWRVEEAD